MKAARINAYGHADVIEITTTEKPVVGAGQVLVEVQAAGLNPFDTMVREGALQQRVPLKLPITLAADIAGVVAAVGADVANVAVGDRVYGSANVVSGGSGALAEFAMAPAGSVAKMPADLSFQQAAALPLVASSARQALVEHLRLKSGQKLFVHGGAGGIGAMAIQLGKHLGAYVATTATGPGLELVKALGADEVIDYTKQDFAELLHDYDAVYNTVSGDDFGKALTILRRGGVAVTMLGNADEARAKELGVTAINQQTHVTTQALDGVRELVEAGVLKPQVGQVFPLTEARAAFEAREHGAQGKVVVAIGESS